MKRNLVVVAAVLAGLGSMATADVPKRGYIDVPAPHDLTPASISHVIFMDRCTGGCTITPGSDGTQNQSQIIGNSTIQLSAYSGSDAQWQQIVSCVKTTYAPFNVTITDVKPTGAYHHAMVAGTSTEGGQGTNVLGVSPFSCGNYIPNSMSFSFANEEPTNIVDICWTVSQETAHSWGLDHKYDKLDPMTYLAYAVNNVEQRKIFQNQAGSCGTGSAMPCKCPYPGTGTSAMNSYALIMAVFGAGTPDTTPPTVSITSPSNNASIMPGFAIAVQAADDVAISKVELRIDGTLIDTDTSAPFSFTAPATLSQGSHHVEATATDASNNSAKAAIDVVYGELCTTNGCTDSTQVCDNGHCVPGPTTTGGLGSPCTDNTVCASGSCGDDGAGNKYCVTACDPTNNTCPSGFGCVSTGAATGVCWPGDNGGGGGCNTGSGGGSILAGLGFAAALLSRRKRR
ncbi:MAG: Ig-like domain-containing protein [Deltaproteobacteria bacterium]